MFYRSVNRVDNRGVDRVERALVINTAIEAGGKAAALLIAAASLALAARYLSPDGFGRYQLALAYFTVFGVAVDLGLTTILVRESSRNRAIEARLAGIVLALRLTASTVVMMVALAAAWLLPYDRALRGAIAIAGVGVFCAWIQGPLAAPFQTRLRMMPVVAAELTGRLAGLAAMVIVLALDAGLSGVVAATSLAALITLVVTAFAVHGVVPIQLVADRVAWRHVLAAGLPLGVAAALDILYVRIDVFILAIYRPFYEVGLYSMAYRVYELLLLVPGFFIRSLFPVLAREMAEGRTLIRQRIQRATFLVIAAGLPTVAAGVALAPQLVRLVGGEAFAGATVVLRLLLAAVLFSALNSLARHIIIAGGEAGRAVWLYAAGLIINVAVNVALIPRYGAPAAALAMVASETAMLGGHLFLLTTRPFPGRPPTRFAAE